MPPSDTEHALDALGRLIRQRRDELDHMSQARLAELLGVTQPYVSMVERGQQVDVSTSLLGRLAKALDVPFESLAHAALVRVHGGALPPGGNTAPDIDTTDHGAEGDAAAGTTP